MATYGYRTRQPEKDYFADVRFSDGCATGTHVRTNLGRKAAYAMIAKHYDGGKIVSFRDEVTATREDKEQARESDGALLLDVWAGYSSRGESYAEGTRS